MHRRWLLFFAWLAVVSALGGTAEARRYLVVGDSLSKEYEFEGPLLWSSFEAWKARNWMEILKALRGSEFDFGEKRSNPFNPWPDSRLLGHEYNWAVPSATTDDWLDALEGGSLLEGFLLAAFEESAAETDRAVVMLGANDVNENYTTYYNGANGSAFRASVRDRLREIVRHLKGARPGIEIVVVNLPDVGVSPDVRADHPDPVKRARVTELTDGINRDIAAMAAEEGAGVADLFGITARYAAPPVVAVGGVPMFKGVDPDNDPRYLFSADGFHPNTPAQALIAVEIVRAFNRTFGGNVPEPHDAEIVAYLEAQHDRTIDVRYSEWAGAYGIAGAAKGADADADGLANGLEYALGLDPTRCEAVGRPAVALESSPGGPRLALVYRPRAKWADHTLFSHRFTTNLSVWETLGAGAVTDNADGTRTVRVAATGVSGFLQLSASVSD